jgi:uncharacterized membrane protein YGL010W
MRQIEFLLNEYGESHKNKTNILIHAIAVPAIYFVTLALVWSIPTITFMDYFDITWAHIIVIPTLYYYFRLSGPIGAAMTVLSILFVVMWILQFVGHNIEGKKPSFLKDLQFLLVGPAWWWVHWLKRLNIHY